MKNQVYLFSKRFNIWSTIVPKLRSASGIAVFLDYDGTLTPIRRNPSAAILDPQAQDILQQMVQLPDVQVVIVTGRSMQDIRRLVPVDKIEFAANHGFHIYQKGHEWIHPLAVTGIQELTKLHTILCTALAKFPKASVENKQMTLSIHYRNVASQNVRSLGSLVIKTVLSFDPTLRMTRGKKVLEIRPQIDWGKGHAVLKILNENKTHRKQIPLFIGDDTTDEDVFRALRLGGITIRVGRKTTSLAKYYVKDVEEVLILLKLIMTTRTLGTFHYSRI
jgi:trehalose 6-phosphate phosphatase